MALNLEVNILGEYRNLTKATKGATKQLQGLQNSARKISRSINTAFAAIGVGISFNALKNSIESAVTQASNLEESINAVRVSFGAAADAVLAIGENSATSFGIARAEFNQAAVTFSAFTDEIVGPGGDVASVIEELAQRGADFASVYNIEVSEALRVFRSGLSGESEPLKRFGIILNDTAVKTFAYERGIAEVGKELTNTQKVQARYRLLLEETSKTSGDFANTSGSLANGLRILRATFTDAQASIGQGFAPAINAVVQFIRQNITVFQDLASAIGERLRQAFETTGTSAQNFGTKLITLLTDLTDFLNGTATAGNSFVQLEQKIGPFIELLGAIGELGKGLLAVLNGLAVGLFGWIDIFRQGEQPISGFADLMRILGELLQGIGKNLGIALSFFVPFTKTLDTAKIAIQNILNPGKALQGIAKNIGTAVDDVIKDWANLGKSADEVAKTTTSAANRVAGAIRSTTGAAIDTVRDYKNDLDALDNRRIRNYIDVITTNFTAGAQTIPASPTTDRRPSGPLQPGYSEKFINWRDGNQWYTRTWTGYKWKITKDADAYKTPSGTGKTEGDKVNAGIELFRKKVTNVVTKLQEALEDSKQRIQDASENFRDAVQLSFGIITNGAFAVFDVNRVIRQMQRIRDAAATFADDIKKLQEQGADQSLIDQLLGMDPISGATAARGLLSSGRLQEFLDLRNQLAGIGTSAAEAANMNLYGANTTQLTNAIDKLSRVIEKGAGNTYNINLANTSKLTAQEIINAIKQYEKTTGKKVFSN
jgi:hypothetical protein